ncbi:mutS protein homolog 4-like isoform X2 [Choristoneura fumiferana]|uniref:mutS protein homolog 4-like isoform X2 n=1 Tax=Choristoneura fumiferana TaxID=7141 RepID=UPI003D15442F
MNVVQRETINSNKINKKSKKDLVRKEFSWGIRGGTSLLPNKSTISNSGPRYQFINNNNNGESTSKPKISSMGPPLEPLKSLKRKLLQNSNSTKPESSSSGKARQPRVLASDSAAAESDFCTPKNRPNALRYISSSSRGGYSGTRSARSSSTAVEPSVILAISEGRGMARGEIGMAAIDLRHPNLVLCQFSDSLLYTHTMTKINYFNPIEIIVPNTFCEGVQPSQLYQLIRDQYPLLNLTTVQRRHFNDAVGRQHIQTLCAPHYSPVFLQILDKFYALTAAAAVLKYVEYIQCVVFARESLKIEYHSSENTMIIGTFRIKVTNIKYLFTNGKGNTAVLFLIDVGTATQLELVQPLLPSAGATCCLLGVLGPTYTVGGIRALRAAILQPSCKKEFIENRLDAVQDLIENESGLMIGLQDVVKKLSDIDRILLLCVEPQNQDMNKMGEAQLNQVLLLKTTLEMVPKLVEALKVANSGRLQKMKMDFENPQFNEISERIKNIIQDDAHLEKGAMGSLQRCFAVKPDINGLLDVARRTYSELIDDIQKIVEHLGESYELPIRLNQNMMKGFHIVLTISPNNRRNFNVEELPPIFIQVQNNGTRVSMTTEELVVLDQQAKESLNEIQKMSNIVIGSLLKDLRPFMSSLYKLCENVAELDILLSIAQASTVGSYTRPDFSNHLDIRNSIHPLLDYNSQTMPVPNDIYASPEQNFTIITGPNMGGKSIYIKQIAVLQIMAQVGCFLPATNAVLRICDRVFSRIGFNDSVELNASTYVIEMKEIQHILKGLTTSSLVIIDELCRGTSTEEGTSIAWAVCEDLLASDAFIFFTTHFMYLTRLQDLYFNVVNLHTEVREEEMTNSPELQKRLVYEHKIKSGITNIKNYGLSLAAKTNLPSGTIQLAWELAELIDKNRNHQDTNSKFKSDNRLLYELNAAIRKESRRHPNNESFIRNIKIKFKEDNPQLIERLKVQRRRANNYIDTSDNNSSVSNTRQEPSNDGVINSRNSYSSSDQLNRIPLSINRSQQRPIVYTDGDDKENRDLIHNLATTECRGVKSSTELLNTMMHLDNNNINQNPENTNDGDENEDNYFEEARNENFDNDEDDTANNTAFIDGSIIISDVHINEGGLRNDTNDPFTGSDSELAEAMTQIIECSIQTKTKDDSEVSTDEELIKETVNDINMELESVTVSLEDLVLPPPLEFRD